MYPANWRKPQDKQNPQPHGPARKPGRFNSPVRRAYTLGRLVERVNTGRVTVASYLADLGADADTIRRYSATLGKHVKAAYQAKYSVEPVRSAIAVVGRRIVRAFAYDAGDAEILRAAVAGYGRVSHLLNGAS
jgi:hypothetical protein